MSLTLRKDRVPSLDAAAWARLTVLFAAGGTFTPEEIAAGAGLDVTVATALCLALHVEKLAQLFWRVFHCGDLFYERRFQDGFQPTPWTCPKCRKTVLDDDLRYELRCTLRGPVTFA